MTSNNTSNDTDDQHKWFVFVAYWELMVCILGTPLNLLVVFVWSTLASKSRANRQHGGQSRNRWFILSMTCGDLLFTSIHSPIFFAWYADYIQHMTDELCMIVYGTTHLSMVVSSISLLLLNVDKFIYLHWPLHYSSMMTRRKALLMTACGWLVALTWAILFLFGGFIERQDGCLLVIKHRMFYASFLVLFFLMPIILSTATSIYIAVVAVRARLAETATARIVTTVAKPVNSSDSDSNSPIHPPKKKSALLSAVTMRTEIANTAAVMPWRTITFVFTTTIWCTLTYLPYRVSLCISTITGQRDNWQLFLYAIMVTYAAGNPIITIVTQPTYRRRVAEIFRLSKPHKDSTTCYTDALS